MIDIVLVETFQKKVIMSINSIVYFIFLFSWIASVLSRNPWWNNAFQL